MDGYKHAVVEEGPKWSVFLMMLLEHDQGMKRFDDWKRTSLRFLLCSFYGADESEIRRTGQNTRPEKV
jgi:hypothetical protein